MADRRLPSLPKVLVLLPTYNERDNLPVIADRLLAYADLRVLVIDDGSPDGTGQIADGIAAASDGRLAVLHRTGKRGLGRSYVDGMRAALATDAELILQMDADLSHDPKYLPDLVAAAAGARRRHRLALPAGRQRGQLAAAAADPQSLSPTGTSAPSPASRVRDCTTGFRCWRRAAIGRLPLDRIVSDGYSFLVETLFLALEAGLHGGRSADHLRRAAASAARRSRAG